MYDTAEGQQKGRAWARQAIWGNMTPEMKARYGNVDNVTSGDFANEWNARYAGIKPSQRPILLRLGPRRLLRHRWLRHNRWARCLRFRLLRRLAQGQHPALLPALHQAPIPQSPINISQFQRLTPLQWVQLFRG